MKRALFLLMFVCVSLSGGSVSDTLAGIGVASKSIVVYQFQRHSKPKVLYAEQMPKAMELLNCIKFKDPTYQIGKKGEKYWILPCFCLPDISITIQFHSGEELNLYVVEDFKLAILDDDKYVKLGVSRPTNLYFEADSRTALIDLLRPQFEQPNKSLEPTPTPATEAGAPVTAPAKQGPRQE